MEQSWFEMKDIEKRRFNNAVWIPLYASQQLEESGKFGYDGYKDEYFACHTLAVPVEKRDNASKLGWNELGMIHDNTPWIDEDRNYIPAGFYIDNENDLEGVFLTLEQYMEQPEGREIHLNQDFVLALRLKREGDVWVRQSEGYIEVARLRRNPDGTPCLLEVRAEHLKDYLCARKMTMFMTTYRERHTVEKNEPQFTWNGDSVKENETDKWEGYITEIHEGGNPFGEEMAVFHVARTDIDGSEDVPVMGSFSDDNLKSESWTRRFSGSKQFSIYGRLWRNEWIEPSEYSPRIARDELPSTVYFITDAEGKRENKDTLERGGRWLWFKPSVIMELTARRGGSLNWYTRETGGVGCLKTSCVHFGINPLGLINIYAKDIAQLPDWQQQIWAGHNIAPEGGVSKELLDSQVDAEPAETQAPEAFLEKGLKRINELSADKLGFCLFKEHDSIPEILEKCHRFRAVDRAGLYELAKDLARVTADSIDISQIQKTVKPPKGEKWGSLKSLENLLATKTDPKIAREIVGRLVGIYVLRLADAHLPSREIESALKLIGIDDSVPHVHQGYQIMSSCVGSLYGIIHVLENW